MTITEDPQGHVLVDGTEESELFEVSADIALVVSGNGGNDTLIGVSAGSVDIYMGSGSDLIQITAQSGAIIAGDGNDTIEVFGPTGVFEVDAGAGDDVLLIRSGAVTAIGTIEQYAWYAGTGHDYVRGGVGRDTIISGDGNDTIYGRGGDDEIHFEGSGNLIYGGAGKDLFVAMAGAGNSSVYGGAGDDRIMLDDPALDGQNGGMLISMGSGFAEVSAVSRGDDSIQAGDDGSDILVRGGHDVIVTGKGQDFVATFEGSHVIRTSAGRDEINVSNGNNRVFAGAGDDQINFGYQSGKDKVTGGAGDDVFKLLVGTKRDVITDFGRGDDVLDLRGVQAKSFIGADAFSGAKGEVRYDQASGILSGDKNGDGVADWSIRFANKATLTADDFLFA